MLCRIQSCRNQIEHDRNACLRFCYGLRKFWLIARHVAQIAESADDILNLFFIRFHIQFALAQRMSLTSSPITT